MDERLDFEALSAAAAEGSAEQIWTEAVDRRLVELDRRMAELEKGGQGVVAGGSVEHLLHRWEDFSRRLQIIVAVLEAGDERLLELVERVLVAGARASST